MRIFPMFAIAAAALAQAPIQVTTHLVQIVVVVRDKHGPVADLTKKDFEIFDKGKQREIATFSVARATDRPQRAALPPNTFTNHLDQQGDAPVVATVLLFDSLNTPFMDQAAARRQVLDFLRAIDPQSPVAIYALGDNLRVLHDFTEDQSRLVSALQRYRNQTSTLLENSGNPLEALLSRIPAQLQSYSLDRRVDITLGALQAIAHRMAGVPGRKNLIWVSGAFPLALAFDKEGLQGGATRMVTYNGTMKEAAAAIDRANVAVYPVDARGLMAFDTIRTAMPQPRNQGATGSTYSVPTPTSMIGTREVETMQLLANWTGGRAYFNRNDVGNAVKQATADAELTYTLGFYVDEKELDGGYHDLKVKVARKGTDARYRRGYFAMAEPAAGSQPAAEILKNAVTSPVDATGMGLVASLAPAPSTPGSFVLALGMDLKNLDLEQKNGRWADDVDFLVVQQAATGAVLDSAINTIKINVTDENRQTLIKDGLVLRFGIRPAPGLSQIRVAVMDGATGNVGSLRIVPPQAP